MLLFIVLVVHLLRLLLLLQLVLVFVGLMLFDFGVEILAGCHGGQFTGCRMLLLLRGDNIRQERRWRLEGVHVNGRSDG